MLTIKRKKIWIDVSGITKKEVALLQQIDLLYTQQLATLGYEAELKTKITQLDTQTESFRINGPVEERPYPFTLLERLRDELQSQTEMDQAKDAVIQSRSRGRRPGISRLA